MTSPAVEKSKSGRPRRLSASSAGSGKDRHVHQADSEPVVLQVAWLPQGEMALDDWVTAGRRFGAVARCSQWWIGDWIRYGNSQWGEKYSDAARITGYDVGSLRNMAWIASQFDLSLRSDRLSWSHHALLAPLDETEKRRWIERAIDDRLSVSDLRVELRADQREQRAGLAGEADAEAEAPKREGAVICPHCGGDVFPEQEPGQIVSAAAG